MDRCKPITSKTNKNTDTIIAIAGIIIVLIAIFFVPMLLAEILLLLALAGAFYVGGYIVAANVCFIGAMILAGFTLILCVTH